MIFFSLSFLFFNITKSLKKAPEVSVEVDLDSDNTVIGKDINLRQTSIQGTSMKGVITGSTEKQNEMGASKSGKIDLKGAGAQSLQSFYSQKGVAAEQNTDLPKLLALVRTSGEINIDLLSWIKTMQKKFGVEHINYKLDRKS